MAENFDFRTSHLQVQLQQGRGDSGVGALTPLSDALHIGDKLMIRSLDYRPRPPSLAGGVGLGLYPNVLQIGSLSLSRRALW